MLLIMLKDGEAVRIGADILVTAKVKAGKPKLGISAPVEIPIELVPAPKEKRLTPGKHKR